MQAEDTNFPVAGGDDGTPPSTVKAQTLSQHQCHVALSFGTATDGPGGPGGPDRPDRPGGPGLRRQHPADEVDEDHGGQGGQDDAKGGEDTVLTAGEASSAAFAFMVGLGQSAFFTLTLHISMQDQGQKLTKRAACFSWS